MRPRLIAAIVLTLLLLFGAGTSLVLVIIVPFLFDAPGTEEQAATWVMAGAILSAPLTCLAATIACGSLLFPPDAVVGGTPRWLSPL